MAPSLDIRENWNGFALENDLYSDVDDKRNDKRVFVIPVFEIKKGMTPPHNKSQLIQVALVMIEKLISIDSIVLGLQIVK